MNGWNAMTKPPNGKRRSSLLKLSLKDSFAKYIIINRNTSRTTGTISLSEKTVNRIINRMATSLTLPSKLWITVSLDDITSNVLTCSIDITIPINHKFKIANTIILTLTIHNNIFF